MSKPSLREDAKARKAAAWLAYQRHPCATTMRALHEAREAEKRAVARRCPAPRMPVIGKVVAHRRGRIAELENHVELQELDAIADAAGIGVEP